MRALCAVVMTGLLTTSCKRPAPVTPPHVPTAFELVPPGDSVLSVFEPADAGCQWRRVDTSSRASAVVASLPVQGCLGASAAFSSDAGLAAAWFDPGLVQRSGLGGPDVPQPGYPDEPQGSSQPRRVFLVTLASGAVREVPTLPSTAVDDLGLDATGALYALGTEPLSDGAVDAGVVTVDGKRLTLTPVAEGLPALAHAWRLDGATWTRVESVQTTTGWDYALGVSALQTWGTLGPRTQELLDSKPGSDGAIEPAVLEKLAAAAPRGAEGEWRALGVAPTRAFAWAVSGEFVELTGLVVFEAGLTRAPDMGFTAGDLVAHAVKGSALLTSGGAAGTHPRVHALATRALTWSSDTARAVTWWP